MAVGDVHNVVELGGVREVCRLDQGGPYDDRTTVLVLHTPV